MRERVEVTLASDYHERDTACGEGGTAARKEGRPFRTLGRGIVAYVTPPSAAQLYSAAHDQDPRQ